MQFSSVLTAAAFLVSAAHASDPTWHIPHNDTSKQNATNSTANLDRAPSLEDERPWNSGGLVTTDYILAALFPYSAVTLEAVISPLRIIVRTFLRRHKSIKHISEDDGVDTISIPTYADLTDRGWRVPIHGHVLHMEKSYAADVWSRIEEEKRRDKLIERLLFRATMDKTHHRRWRKHFYELNETEKRNARARAGDLLRAPVRDLNLDVNFYSESCNATVPLIGATDREGGFAEDIIIPSSCDPIPSPRSAYMRPKIDELSFYVDSHNSDIDSDELVDGKVYFVPPQGLSVISDIDDVLRVAEVWNVKQAVLWTLARQYKAWLDMPNMMNKWKSAISGIHFHYSTKTPELGAKFYIGGTQEKYPHGSWDFRPVGFANFFSDLNFTSPAYRRLERIMKRFPRRRFVLLGDTTNPDTMRDFPKLMKNHNDQVQCILLRDVQQTEASDWRTPSTRYFYDLPTHKYFFFSRPSDLHNVSLLHLEALSTLPINSIYKLDNPISEWANPTTIDLVEEGGLAAFDAGLISTYTNTTRLYINEGCFPREFNPNNGTMPKHLTRMDEA
ncbi:Hypothetical protein D9617_1g080490 [Elsinoe fawcettii]|nr:Hypothetical protein D9617_1g080490 [Elsinoe fawcettii]